MGMSAVLTVVSCGGVVEVAGAGVVSAVGDVVGVADSDVVKLYV